MKIIKIESCEDCQEITSKYNPPNSRTLSYYCGELKGIGSKITDLSKIHPDCPLDDYPENKPSEVPR